MHDGRPGPGRPAAGGPEGASGRSGRGADGRPASLPLILEPKVRMARRRVARAAGVARGVAVTGLGLGFWTLLFAISYRLLLYFRSAQGIGELLALKLLGFLLLGFLGILVLSNVITALSSFFLARDLELFAAAPVDGLRFYTGRLLETLLHSSWMVVLVLLPVLAAYGWVFGGGWDYAAVALVALAAYLVIPSVLGTALTLLLVNIFPARRARDLLALIALFAAAGVVVLFRLLRPEKLASPEGFRSLVDFMASLDTPSSVWMPSEWAAQAILAPITSGSADFFPLLLLTSTAAALFTLGAWLHGRLYGPGFSRAQEGAELRESRGSERRGTLARLPAAPLTVRALVAKDVRTFFRDTTQWSQLILLAVLVVVYIYNIKVLPLWRGEAVGFFLVNVISFLNLGLAGFILTAIAARFLFPAVSLEGRTFWLLRSSPIELRTMVWTKYWVGLLPLLSLALILTLATNLVLRVGPFMMALSLLTITVACFAIAALALGFGALFPRFETENAAQIPTGFGGLIFMMSATTYLALLIALEAWPVYAFLRARLHGASLDAAHWTALAGGIGLALVLSVVATVLPLRAAVRRVGALEP